MKHAQAIYLILTNHVFKVGTTTSLLKRVDEIVRAHPDYLPLHLYCACLGGFKEERELQGKLREWHYRGEWFRRTDEALIVAVSWMLPRDGFRDFPYGIHYGAVVNPPPFKLVPAESEPSHA